MEVNQNASSPSVATSIGSQYCETDASKEKLPVTVDVGNNLVGPNSGKFMTRAGVCIRARIPIKYKDWRLVPQKFKDDVWNALMGEFELNVNPNLARSRIEEAFPSKFRYAKAALRRTILRKLGQSESEAIAACPIGYNPTTWEEFVKREMKDEVIEACAKNAENRKKNTICHNLGRCTIYNKSYNKIVPADG